MLFVLVAKDKPNRQDLRQKTRAAHLEHVRKTGVVRIAGPLLDEKGGMCGSLVVLDVETQEQAQEWARKDPYAMAGLFASVEIHAWKKVIG